MNAHSRCHCMNLPVGVGFSGETVADLGHVVNGVRLLHLSGLLGLRCPRGTARRASRWRTLHRRSARTGSHRLLGHAGSCGVAIVRAAGSVGRAESGTGRPHLRGVGSRSSRGHCWGALGATGVHTSTTSAAGRVSGGHFLARMVKSLLLCRQFDLVAWKQ